MRERVMNFSQDWSNLDEPLFTTIRRHKGDLKYVPDETVQVVSPSKRFRARVLFAGDWKLKDIPLSFLEYDLDRRMGEKRGDLIAKLRKLYKWSEPPTEKDFVTVYLLRKV
jgi:hypothetical protein